jgi:hypothetical protein
MVAIFIISVCHSLCGQDIEPAGPAVASVGSSGQPLTIMGLDLSDAKFVRSEKDVPDIYEQSGKQRADVFIMPLEKPEPATTAAKPPSPTSESIWLKYTTSVNRFYIEYRSDRNKPETQRIYGPFAGDPLERFRLEPVIAARLRARYSPNDLQSIGRMLRTQDATLSQRALRLAQAAIKCQETTILESIVADIRRMLKENAATIKKLDLQAGEGKLEEDMRQIDAKLEALTVEIPDSQYVKAADIHIRLPDSIPEKSWSEPLGGLRAAAVPKQDTVAVGDDLPIILVVENTSDHDIKFSLSDLIQSARAEIVNSKHQPIQTSTNWFSGWAALERFILKPGERVALASVTLRFLPQQNNPRRAGPGETEFFDAQRDAANSAYQVRYTVPLATGSRWQRGDDGVMRRVSPAKGEWNGTLTSGFVDFRVTDKQP